MKIKKLLSLLTAAALTASSMAGLAVTASAADLPADRAWTTADAAWVTSVTSVTADGTALTAYNGLNGYGAWAKKNANNITYTHTDGTAYTFKTSFQAGAGNTTKRSFYFTPETSCIVTVVYSAQSGRPMNIAQGGKVLISGEEGLNGSAAPSISYDIEDPSKGDVYVYGGSSNKQLYGIFVDYYDANAVVYQTLSGSISYNGSENTSALKIVFEDTTDGTKYEVPFGSTYSVDVRQNRSYDVYVAENGVKSGSVCTSLDTNSVSVAKIAKTFDIDVVDVAATEVTGDVVVHDVYNDGTSLDLSKVQLTFTAQDDASLTYTTGITSNKIAVTMEPNHTYNITASGNDGYALSTLSGTYTLAPGDASPFKNILFTETVSSVAFKDTVEVGSDKEFATISDAVTAIKKMSRSSGEAGRVAIVVDPGTYTEQVIVDTNYVTIKAADEANRPKIEWYYGVGYLYYSSAGNGYYSEDYAVAKTKKGTVQRWGAAVRVTGSNVLLENIIFENTLNGKVTDAELADGVEAAKNNEYSDVNGKPERNVANYDPKSRAAVERAAAIALDGAYAEAYQCDFISSQDTFYTGSSAYIKDCYIEGGTDYIFGGNDVVFDGCTLAWHGYSDQSVGGYITANKNSAAYNEGNSSTYGYLFLDSTVTNSKYYTSNKFAAGSWGRNWGGAATRVIFDGVKMDGVDLPGAWSKMGGELSTSILYVENVTDKSGAAVDTSGTKFNPNGTMEANGVEVEDPTVYFGSWVPVHYDGEVPENNSEVLIDLRLMNQSTTNSLLTADEVTNKTEVTFGVDKNGNRVDVDSADSIATLTVKYHSDDHGMNNFKLVVPVSRAAKITVGTCAWGSNINVTAANGVEVQSVNTNTGACYHSDPAANVVTTYYASDDPTTLTISGGSYVPYINVTLMDAADIPQYATVTYSLGGVEAEGTLPADTTVLAGKNVTIPLNRTLYAEGKTLTGWTDGTNTYAPGTKLALDADKALTAVFADNTEAVSGSVTFDFQQNNGAPIINSQNGTGIYVGQSTNGIDVKLDYDTNNGGKLANANWGDWAQCNGGTVFTVPVVENSVVTMGDVYGSEEYTINGVAKTGGNQSETITGKTSAEIAVTKGGYIRSINVTYPASEQAEFSDLKLDLMKLSNRAGTDNEFLTADEVANKSNFTVGVTAEGKRTTEGAANAIATLSGKYHSEEHGINPTSLVIAVPGTVKITVGTCNWGGNVTIKDADGNTVDTINSNTGACYHNNTTENVVSTYYKEDKATTLTITGGNYWPYIAVEKVDASEIPNDATVTFSVGTSGAQGTAPAAVTADIGTAVTIPVNRTLYTEGSTLTGWTDGTTTYAIGDTLTLTADVTLDPVFTANTEDPSGSVTFDFQQKNGAPVLNSQNGTGFYVGQSTNGVDVKINYDTTSGKLANGNWQDWAQMNNGTKFTLPVAKGTVITVDNFYQQSASKTVCTINGTEIKSDDASYDVTIDSDTTAEIVIGSCSYYRTIKVTYPELTDPTFTEAQSEVYTQYDGDDAVAFTTEMTPGTATPKKFVWNVTNTETNETRTADVDMAKISGKAKITFGLIVIVKNTDVDASKLTAELTAE